MENIATFIDEFFIHLGQPSINSVEDLLNKPDTDIMEILSAIEFTIQLWNNLANAAYAYVDDATTIVNGKRHIQLWLFKEEKMKEDEK
ncbi:hypothetical protein HK096_000216 [Nowakowskiella sp. JEL0078]|nr:hypothetical protein HK096_000216 [Nowakowskiella sp. JEL0078]